MIPQENELNYQPFLDELIAWATTEERKPDLIAAKATYFELTGEVHEDEHPFEMRMASFLDYYLFDRPSPITQRTPAQTYYEEQERSGPPDRAAAFRAFTETVHGLFEVRKMAPGLVRLRELHTGKDFDITERRQLVGLEKGDLIEARLIPFGGHLVFSSAFCYHPKAAFKAILKEAKRRRKKEPDRPPQELVWECGKMALKSERYKQIALERIYDFEKKSPF